VLLWLNEFPLIIRAIQLGLFFGNHNTRRYSPQYWRCVAHMTGNTRPTSLTIWQPTTLGICGLVPTGPENTPHEKSFAIVSFPRVGMAQIPPRIVHTTCCYCNTKNLLVCHGLVVTPAIKRRNHFHRHEGNGAKVHHCNTSCL
jgi:hypothetical protein